MKQETYVNQVKSNLCLLRVAIQSLRDEKYPQVEDLLANMIFDLQSELLANGVSDSERMAVEQVAYDHPIEEWLAKYQENMLGRFRVSEDSSKK